MNKFIDVGDRVIYIPTHAEGNINHPDCEYGTISSWNDTYIFVKYVKNGIPQMTAQATDPRDLYLDGKGDGFQNILEIFNKINNEDISCK